MLTLTEDTTPGVHDMIWSACDAERYHMQGYDGYHDNCTDNMHKVSKLGSEDEEKTTYLSSGAGPRKNLP